MYKNVIAFLLLVLALNLHAAEHSPSCVAIRHQITFDQAAQAILESQIKNSCGYSVRVAYERIGLCGSQISIDPEEYGFWEDALDFRCGRSHFNPISLKPGKSTSHRFILDSLDERIGDFLALGTVEVGWSLSLTTSSSAQSVISGTETIERCDSAYLGMNHIRITSDIASDRLEIDFDAYSATCQNLYRIIEIDCGSRGIGNVLSGEMSNRRFQTNLNNGCFRFSVSQVCPGASQVDYRLPGDILVRKGATSSEHR